MGKDQVKIVRVNNEKIQVKSILDKKIKKNSEGKSLVAFATLGCRKV